MAQRGHEVFGIDISATATDWAGALFESAGVASSIRHGNVCGMPFFEKNMFDVVMDGACLHCLIGENRKKCLAEVARVMRPDGAFIVSSMCGAPKSEDARARFDAGLGCLMKDGKPYRSLRPLVDIEVELTDAGFVVKDHWLRVNPWWDHVTITCRKRDGVK